MSDKVSCRTREEIVLLTPDVELELQNIQGYFGMHHKDGRSDDRDNGKAQVSLIDASLVSPIGNRHREERGVVEEIPEQQRNSIFVSGSKNNVNNNGRNDDDDNSDEVAQEDPKFKFGAKNWIDKWRVLATCLWFMGLGWGDATAGTILQYVEDYYNISYAIVSLIWLGTALGYITVACLSHEINKRFKVHTLFRVSAFSAVIAMGIVSSGTKTFPAIVIAYYINGVGGAIGLSQFNVQLSRYDIGPMLLGCAHGSYGLGATIAPIIATSMTSAGVEWYFFYLILTGLMIFTTLNLHFAFKGIDQDIKELNEQSGSSTSNNNNGDQVQFSESLKNLNTWLICFFILFYQGAEVGLAGYIVSYLLNYRSGPEKTVGYVASGFWGGLTIGRFLVTDYFAKRYGARRGIITMTIISIVFILLAWLVPNFTAEAVLISIAGIAIGPMYPMSIAAASKILPRKIVVVSLTLASAFGSTGGSLFPFIIGLISQFKGSFVVMPFSIALFVAMVTCWLVLPNIDRRGCNTKKATTDKINDHQWWKRFV